MKSLKILALAGALLTTSATATTYSTTINIVDLAGNLTWVETAGMQFPTLLLDGLTVTGHDCRTDQTHPTWNELCPGNRDNVSNSEFSVSGLPGAEVGIQLDITPQIKEGIQFGAFHTANSLILDATGDATHSVAGKLVLVDRSAIVNNSITFTFDLEFTAQ